MAFSVIYDACVLYPAPLRDLLVRLARTGLVHAQWSDQILDECFRNILANRPDLRPESPRKEARRDERGRAMSVFVRCIKGFAHRRPRLRAGGFYWLLLKFDEDLAAEPKRARCPGPTSAVMATLAEGHSTGGIARR